MESVSLREEPEIVILGGVSMSSGISTQSTETCPRTKNPVSIEECNTCLDNHNEEPTCVETILFDWFGALS